MTQVAATAKGVRQRDKNPGLWSDSVAMCAAVVAVPYPPSMKALTLIVSFCLLTSCDTPISSAEVAELMETQRQAWNRGELAEFVSYYDASMTFCGSNGVTRGLDKLLARYKKKYPTAKERGVLTFKILETRPLGSDTALVIGQYILDRDDPASGFFSVIVQRTSDGVRIIHDHSSATEKKE